MYSSMSFYVLSFVEPSSHSIIKLLSRSVIVTSLTVIFGMKEFSIQLAIGIMFCIIGALLYALSISNITFRICLPKLRNKKRLFVVASILSRGIVAGMVVYTPSIQNSRIHPIINFAYLTNISNTSTAPIFVHTTSSLERISVTNQHLDLVDKLLTEALKEVGLKKESLVTFKYPIIPTGGYRGYLKRPFDYLLHKCPPVYLGERMAECNDCRSLKSLSRSFVSLSAEVCQSRAIYCGVGSTFLCRLLGVSTKTIVHVDMTELES